MLLLVAVQEKDTEKIAIRQKTRAIAKAKHRTNLIIIEHKAELINDCDR
jgi:hypothetical protein